MYKVKVINAKNNYFVIKSLMLMRGSASDDLDVCYRGHNPE